MFKALFVSLLLVTGCITDDAPPEPPYCVDLGAKPDQPLLCNKSGLCVYDGQSCRTGTPSDAGAGSASEGQ